MCQIDEIEQATKGIQACASELAEFEVRVDIEGLQRQVTVVLDSQENIKSIQAKLRYV